MTTLPGTSLNQAEVFFDHEQNDLLLINGGRITPFDDWPIEILTIFSEELNNDPVAQATLDADKIINPTECLFLFIKCRYGALNKKADITNGHLDDNTEYFNCGLRNGRCKHEGKRCHELVSINGILSRREKEVMICIAQGMTAKEVGEKLYISEDTVRSHRQSIIYKIGGHNVQDLTRFACKRGLMDCVNVSGN